MNDDPLLPSSPPARNDTVLDWARGTGSGDLLAGGLDRYLRRRRRRRLAFASTFCAVLLVAGLTWFRPREVTSVATATQGASATILRPERRMLPDGSTIDLKAGAEIELKFTDSFRRVVLRKGEAHFEVTKDAQRPFIVSADGIEVRAVGTAFAVDLGTSAVDVLVTEGRVAVNATPPSAVSSPGSIASPSAPLMTALPAGGRVVVDRKASAAGGAALHVSELSAADMQARLAWRVPRLKFAAAPLAQVIAMFNEHAVPGRDARLVLASDVPENVRVSGLLRADDVDSLLRLLGAEFGISVEKRVGEIVLHRP